jgi:hypothetical protein
VLSTVLTIHRLLALSRLGAPAAVRVITSGYESKTDALHGQRSSRGVVSAPCQLIPCQRVSRLDAITHIVFRDAAMRVSIVRSVHMKARETQ